MSLAEEKAFLQCGLQFILCRLIMDYTAGPSQMLRKYSNYTMGG